MVQINKLNNEKQILELYITKNFVFNFHTIL
jgi:hypothetical protein